MSKLAEAETWVDCCSTKPESLCIVRVRISWLQLCHDAELRSSGEVAADLLRECAVIADHLGIPVARPDGLFAGTTSYLTLSNQINFCGECRYPLYRPNRIWSLESCINRKGWMVHDE